MDEIPRKILYLYDPREDLDRTVRSLALLSLNARPFFGLVDTPQRTSEKAKAWYDSRVAEIEGAERQYRQRLESARETGRIESSDKIFGLLDFQNPFERLKQEVRQTYLGLAKP